ncbi:MAG: arginine deiminase family protein, partial [Saprospiraceae bacterium]|nr:arginine deiminase family protein [Saprospiraceae bacterium]
MAKKIQVSSEIGNLKRVIVHRPDEGISRISPRKAEELLFDDIVHLPQMQQEHDVFTTLLEHFLGKENVLETEDLLKEAIENDRSTTEVIIDKIIIDEDLPNSFKEKLTRLPSEKLAKVLITGYLEDEDFYLFDPIPNFIFTRDIAVTINDHVVITKAAKSARARENFLTRLIFWAHPDFSYLKKEGKLINLNDLELFPPSRSGEQVSVEGGDMMILNENYLLIGCSERSTAHAIHSLRDILFEKGAIKNVVQINIPNDRSYMHIDTIFTQINKNHIVAYKPIVVDGMSSNVEVHKHNGTSVFYSSIRDFIKNEINPNMEFLLSGQGLSPWQEREQWTDGCNLVT